MIRSRVPLGAALVALATAACTGAPRVASAPSPTPATPATPAASTTPTTPAAAQLVQATAALLLDAHVWRTDNGLTVASWWAAATGHGQAIATSDDGFTGACCYRSGSRRTWLRLTGSQAQPAVPVLEGQAQAAADSLDPHLRAVVAGGDGATGLPFEAAARSTDGGPWVAVRVRPVHGAQPSVSGQVVLRDGRLLVLLDHWSDDRGTPGRQWHGLWVSRGADWTSYLPRQPRFTPALTAAPRGFSPLVSLHASVGRGDVVWVTTWDRRLYVSVDGAHTFREIPDR